MRKLVLGTAILFVLAALAATPARAQTSAPARPDAWMGELFAEKPSTEDQTLARFIFPGTHDSGTYGLTSVLAQTPVDGNSFADMLTTCHNDLDAYALGSLCSVFSGGVATYGLPWARAQHLNIHDQLAAGARYFDLRFYYDPSSGHYFVHHTFQGPDLSTVLTDIENFMQEPGHGQEVIMLRFGALAVGDGGTSTTYMSTAQLDNFFGEVYTQLGVYMAQAPNTCSSDPCPATAQFGAQTTIRQMLEQQGGHQIIVFFDGLGPNGVSNYGTYTPTGAFASYLWNNPGSSGFWSLLSDYPSPDDSTYPWISDANIAGLMHTAFSQRDSGGFSNDFWQVGFNMGLESSAKALIRSIACQLDTQNVSGYCAAVNDDWDEFQSLVDMASYVNPKAVGALVGMRRRDVNIITVDHYDPSITQEIFKLNRGATSVLLLIDHIDAGVSFDTGSEADFYPIFYHPSVPPTAWDPRVERNIQIQNNDHPYPGWPNWKSYPNDWGDASVDFAIKDADSGLAGADDPANISGGSPIAHTVVPITACVQDSSNCLRPSNPPRITAGTSGDKAAVYYNFSVCVWSWAPGDLVSSTASCAPTSVLTWPTPAAITYGTALGATQLNASANVAGTFAYAPSSGTVLGAGVHTLTVTFTPTDSTFDTATATVQLTVNKANATVLVTPYTVTYDGHPHTAAVTSITGVNGETGGTVGTVDVSHTTHTNAATYASDSWTFTGTANYNNIAAQTITDTINRANATVVVTPYTVTYDGHPHTAAVTSITGVNGETGGTVGTVDISHTTHTNAATYASDYWTFTGTANYNNIAAQTITDTINRANATVVVTPYTVTYDGHPHTAAVTSITGVNGETGGTVGTVDVSNTTHTNAATYASDSWTFTGTANYNNIAAQTITDTINRAQATISITNLVQPYSGGPDPVTITTSLGVCGTPAPNVTYNGSSTPPTSVGSYSVTASLANPNCSGPNATGTLIIFAYASPGGSFVIGDLSATGNPVSFWSSQWSALNSLSGGTAPSSFKGFADQSTSAPVRCGGTWTTDPGDSSVPPATVPAYMAVVVTGSTNKSGSMISGDIKQIVVVRTDSGYGPAPGHAGTGTVVARVCP